MSTPREGINPLNPVPGWNASSWLSKGLRSRRWLKSFHEASEPIYADVPWSTHSNYPVSLSTLQTGRGVKLHEKMYLKVFILFKKNGVQIVFASLHHLGYRLILNVQNNILNQHWKMKCTSGGPVSKTQVFKGVLVWSVVRELRSYILCSTAKKYKTK